jgi:anaerobic ribonucleoside-triphosphate reductase activating protein
MADIMLRIAGTADDSIVDGPGIRFTIFTQGCPHNCEGCHNPQTHSFDGGMLVTIDSILGQIFSNPLLDGVTFSGGEPFCQAEALYYMGLEIKKHGMDIIAYTGFTFEYLIEHSDSRNFYKELLSVCDYIVDGKFEIDKKDYMLKFKGSSNQRIIDCKKSLSENIVIEAEF